MAGIKEQIVSITYILKTMIESGVFSDYIDLRSFQDHQGYNDFFIELELGKESAVIVELQIYDLGDGLKALIKVYDFSEDYEYGSEKVDVPLLKEYLTKHPLLQFPDSPNRFEDFDYYLNKSIPPEYAKETFIALALIVQDFFRDSL